MIGTTLLVATVQQAALTGVVRDSVDLEPVAFAQVTVAAVGGQAVKASVVADRHGAFVVPGLPGTGRVRVEAGAYGYAVWTGTYEAVPSEPILVLLRPAPIGLEGVDVTVSGRAGDPLSLSRDAFVVDSVLIRSLPTILETDVLRAIQVSPAASAASDYTSVPFIRGGTSDGTPVLLDGVRLFNAVHLGGFVSAINAEAVERATLLTASGGNALATGSLSGAIDIATRDGARDRRRMAGSVGLASSRLSVEGPIGENTSYMVDGRRTYIEGFTRVLERMRAVEKHLPYFFTDIHAKVTKDLGGVRRFSVSGYLNSESLKTFDAQETLELGMTSINAAFSVHYRDRLGANGIIDASLGHSRFGSDLAALGGGGLSIVEGDTIYNPPTDTLMVGDGSMGETRADVRLTWRAGRATVAAGTQAIRFVTDQDYEVTRDVEEGEEAFFTPLTLRRSSFRLATYSSVEVPLEKGFSTRAGLRVDHFRGLGSTLAPFGQVSYGTSWWSARISASRSYQALASVRNEEALLASFLAFDLLVPVSEGPIPRNTEISVGWEGSHGGLRVRLDAYARALHNLRLPDPGVKPISGVVLGDPSLWEVASGGARGIETSWSWMGRRGITLLGSYRWASVSRTVGSQTYTPRFHRNHEFELGSSYRRGGSLWSTRFSLRSGQPVTPLLAIVPFRRQGPYQYTELLTLGGEYNSSTLPYYARIDLGWRHETEVSWFGGGSVVPYVSVANLFSLPNVVGWVVQRGWYSHNLERVYLRQLPMIPFIGMEFRF
ncbi:MAG: TonB-dependent receptor [Gemmatimonadota bacterium]|nr:TonB-dependent receptor [Gemmatimonadota bacterium]MDE2872169.1 TonB-dependent receptor [Gemmatimonadota bacterium]